jgi:hypothetical protein
MQVVILNKISRQHEVLLHINSSSQGGCFRLFYRQGLYMAVTNGCTTKGILIVSFSLWSQETGKNYEEKKVCSGLIRQFLPWKDINLGVESFLKRDFPWRNNFRLPSSRYCEKIAEAICCKFTSEIKAGPFPWIRIPHSTLQKVIKIYERLAGFRHAFALA